MSLCCDLISVSESTTTLSSKYSRQYTSVPVTLGGVPGTMGVLVEGNNLKYQFHVTNPNTVTSTVFTAPTFSNSAFVSKISITATQGGTLPTGVFNANWWSGGFCVTGYSPSLTTFGGGTVSNQFQVNFPGATFVLSTGGSGLSLTNPPALIITFNATAAPNVPCTIDVNVELVTNNL